MGAATHNTAVTDQVEAIVVDQGTFFTGVAEKAPTTLKSIGTELSTTFTDGSKAVGDKILATPENILNIPIAKDVSLPSLSTALSKGDTDEMSKALENITGVKLGGATGLLPGASNINVEKRIDDYMAAIRRQILDEIKNCIEKCLNELINEHPIIGILLDLEGFIQRRISKYRLELQRKIRAKIEELAFQKLKLWQTALIRQKILENIRKACPCDGPEKKSPTYIKRLQDDTTWRLLDGKTDVDALLAGGGASSNAFADDPNNTARYINDILSEAITQAQNDAVNQFRGYNESGWNNFVDSDGNIKSEYINSNGDLVDSTDIYADIKRLKLCND